MFYISSSTGGYDYACHDSTGKHVRVTMYQKCLPGDTLMVDSLDNIIEVRQKIKTIRDGL